VTTSELLKLAPGADTLLRADLAASIAQFLDQQFIDPSAAPVPNISPGSITYGLTAIPSTDDPLTDLHALRSAYWATNSNPPVLLISPQNRDVLLWTLPRDVRETMTILASTALDDLVVLLDPQAVLVADDAQLEMATTRQASVQMDDAPTDPPGAAAVMTSLWQNNLVGLRAERYVNWKRGRESAVHVVTGADYAPTPPSV
jgi:hypothetical protein